MYLKVKNITKNVDPYIIEQMKLQDPLSETEFFDINNKYRFVRTYSKNKLRLFQFSISRGDGKAVSTSFIKKILRSNLVDGEYLEKYVVDMYVSPGNVVHLFNGRRKDGKDE
jgi:hypothetical protein